MLQLLATPEIASKRVVWRQYDHQVGTNTVVPPGSDAAVVRIKGTTKALAISTDGNAAYTCLDPYMGGAIAVAEAARNVACTGAKPIALTNCLNFGNPEKPEVYYQLKEAIRGMADAARALGIPVVSGNVSLYNENNGEAIWPTPVVGCVGLIEDVNCVVPMAFQAEGDAVLLVSAPTGGATPASIGGSEYLRLTRGIVAGKPSIDLHAAARLQRFLQDASSAGLLASAHDIAAGGLAVALAESCIAGDAGVDAAASVSRTSDLLFGEPQSNVIVSCVAGRPESALQVMATAHGLTAHRLGVVAGDRLRIGAIDVSVADLRDAYESGLPHALEGVAANA